MIEIKSTFQAESVNIFNFFTQQNKTGFYIPAYQRNYSWERDKVRQLIEDVASGLFSMNENMESLAFIGTLILVKDDSGRSVYPSLRAELPNNVLLLIDGQQRVSTLLTTSVILSYYLEKLLKQLDSNTSPAHNWLLNVSRRAVTNLKNIYSVNVEDANPEHEYLAYYPRVIRAELDQWSRNDGEAKYDSPISSLISNKIRLDHNQINIKEFESYLKGIQEPFLAEAIKEIKKCFDAIIENEPDDTYDIFHSNLYTIFLLDQQKHRSLFYKLPMDDMELGSTSNLISDLKAAKLFRLISFTYFFLDRVCVTSVLSTNESYAFDMFESLNTSGELLTSFETFKPLVVKQETQRMYQNSLSFKYISSIEKLFVRANGNSKAKTQLTNELIGAFSLAEDGTKPSNHMSQQRRMLKKYESRSDKLGFLSHLSSTARFLDEVWYDSVLPRTMTTYIQASKIAETEMLLQVLKDCGHRQALPVLARFYHNFLTDPSERGAGSFTDAVKCALHFFIIWRGSANTTDGIDNAIKALFTNEVTVDREQMTLARYFDDRTRECSTSHLKKLYRSRLEPKSLLEQETWTARMKSVDSYKNQSVAKYILFLLSVYFNIENGKLTPLRSPKYHLLTKENWNLDIELEHIAPSAKTDEWDHQIYERAHSVNTIGNLGLLIKSANASAGNKSWDKKRKIYQLISQNTHEAFNLLKLEFSDMFSENNWQTIESANFSELVSSIPLLERWDLNTIEERTEDICSKIFPKLFEIFN